MKAFILATAVMAIGVTAASAQPRVLVAVATKAPLLVGQQVRIDVTVLAPNYFLSSPQFPLFDMPGAVVTLPDENAQNSSETIEGQTYAGIRRSYLITPQRAGDFALPPAQITFRYAAEPGQPGVDGVVTLPPQVFTAQLPGGAQTNAAALVTKVTVEQSLGGDPQKMQVGGALTRTIDVFAANTQAMMIPPPSFAAPAGVRVYPRDPVLTDVTTDRGLFTGGRRIDQVTYVFEQPGTYVLPAIEIRWFDIPSGQEEISKAPEIAVSVASIPAQQTDLASDLAPPAPQDNAAETHFGWQRDIVGLLVIGGLALAAFWLTRRYGPLVRARAAQRRQAWLASEPEAFARLQRACQNGDAASAYRALGIWASREGAGNIRTLGESAPSLRRETAALERHLYGAGAPDMWNGNVLLDSAVKVRASRRAASRHNRARPAALPLSLNP